MNRTPLHSTRGRVRRLLPLTALLLGCILLAAVLGCDKDPADRSSAPTSRAVFLDTTATGVIRGRVLLTGAPPPMITFPVNCHPGHSKPIPDESVVVDPATGGLKNCVVYLTDLPAASATPSPVVDQIDCRYVPHVVAISVGQRVIFKSSDPVPHNVHIMSGSVPANYGMAGPGTQSHTFGGPEFVRVKCDVHPWMSSWVAVVDSPCYAVTADDGSFEIRNVPPGAQHLGIWHERYPSREQAVEVTADKPVELTIPLNR